MLSKCDCGEKAIAYLAEDGNSWIVSCSLSVLGKCNTRVEDPDLEEAKRKWNEVEYNVPACPKRKATPHNVPPHWFDVFTDKKLDNQLDACCKRTDNKQVEARRSNSRQIAPDIYIMHCECGKTHTRFCVGSTGTHPTTGIEHFRPHWESR